MTRDEALALAEKHWQASYWVHDWITAAILEAHETGRRSMQEEAAKVCDAAISMWRDSVEGSGAAEQLAGLLRTLKP